MDWLWMNIDILIIIEVEISLSSLYQYLGRFWNTLRKHLGSLVELIGNEWVSTAPWASHCCLLLVLAMAVEIGSLLRWTVLEDFWVSLIVQHVKLLSHLLKILRLLEATGIVLVFVREGFKYGCKRLRFWNHLRPRLLGSVYVTRVRGARIRVIVVD